MTNYKYKVEHYPLTTIGGWKEQKFTDYNEMTNYLGHISMTSMCMIVYYKVKGKWKQTRTIEGHID